MKMIECGIYKTSFSISEYQFSDGSVFLPDEFSIFISSGEVITLGYNECVALCTLLEFPDTFIKRKVLIRNIWGDRGLMVDDNSLNQCISRLRKQLNKTSMNNVVSIITLPKVGYKIVTLSYNIKPDEDVIDISNISVEKKYNEKVLILILIFLITIFFNFIVYRFENVSDMLEQKNISLFFNEKNNESFGSNDASNKGVMTSYCDNDLNPYLKEDNTICIFRDEF